MNIHQPKLLIKIESFTKRIIKDGLKRKDLPELVRLLDAFEEIYSCNHRYIDYVGLFNHIAEHQFQSYKQIQNGRYTYASLDKIRDELIQHLEVIPSLQP